MSTVREDVQIYPLLTELTGCLCDELARSGLEATCSCSLVPGVGPTLDFCEQGCDGGCPGEAWVRLLSAYPSVDFPAQDARATCATGLAFEVEVGVGRCLPLGGNDGAPPEPAAMWDTARLQMADMAAMRRAIACCFRGQGDLDYVLLRFDPTQGAGGCLVSTWTFVVQQLG